MYFSCSCVVKYQAKPLIIYTSTKTEESFLSALQRSGMLLIQYFTKQLSASAKQLTLFPKVTQMAALRHLQ